VLVTCKPLNKFIGTPVGADNAVSKLHVDDERSQSGVQAGLIIGPSTVTLSRSEGSVALGSEMLRGVDPECNAWAQQDRAITYSDGRITVFICMIGPQWAFLYPDYFVNLHYRAHRRFIGPRWLFCYSDEKVNLH
jgi:hypothetical protein